jgi:hypothetical protein
LFAHGARLVHRRDAVRFGSGLVVRVLGGCQVPECLAGRR